MPVAEEESNRMNQGGQEAERDNTVGQPNPIQHFGIAEQPMAFLRDSPDHWPSVLAGRGLKQFVLGLPEYIVSKIEHLAVSPVDHREHTTLNQSQKADSGQKAVEILLLEGGEIAVDEDSCDNKKIVKHAEALTAVKLPYTPCVSHPKFKDFDRLVWRGRRFRGSHSQVSDGIIAPQRSPSSIVVSSAPTPTLGLGVNCRSQRGIG